MHLSERDGAISRSQTFLWFAASPCGKRFFSLRPFAADGFDSVMTFSARNRPSFRVDGLSLRSEENAQISAYIVAVGRAALNNQWQR
jgi:hypothetical protein